MIVLKEAVPVEDGGRVADGRKLNMDASTIFLSVVVSKCHISTWAHLNLGHYKFGGLYSPKSLLQQYY